MSRVLLGVAVGAVVGAVACGGTPRTAEPAAGKGGGGATSAEDAMMMSAAKGAKDPESVYGALDVGADYLNFRRVTPSPFLSAVHGNRWVHVYVDERGADAYLRGTEIPIGTTIVKASWLDDGAGRASAVPGPIYVMEKRAPGYAPDHDDWFYAIHWAKPTGRFAKGGPIYWRGESKRAAFCSNCHDNYDRSLGGLTPSSLLPR